jgi:hypothetical protein
MLWTTIGIITALTLVTLGLSCGVKSRWKRVRWFGGLLLGWGVNCVLGASIFHYVVETTPFIIWKGGLMASSFAHIALVATSLHVMRNVDGSAEQSDMSKTTAMIALGGFGLIVGAMAVLSIW